MANSTDFDGAARGPSVVVAANREAIYPLTFSTTRQSDATDIYLGDPSVRKLAEFFEGKGLPAIKNEDQRQHWYEDWISYQASHGLYAAFLSPKEYSTRGYEFDLLKLTRFLEVFAYFSPAHGYSLQVTFLGLFSVLMGSNIELKKEAVAALEAGGLFGLGVSERAHGSDLLSNEFSVAGNGDGDGVFIANGTKYYIGNANSASMISILARKLNGRRAELTKRAPPVLFALRPEKSKGFKNGRKIHTLGIRSAFVGEFDVEHHDLPATDFIAEGRQAWDAVLGTVTLGKFFLGFGSIGICERAFDEAAIHLTKRMLYGKSVIDMPHIGSAVAQAYAHLTAMKLYAYRALDYLRTASDNDRRYLLFNAVQKAKVSTTGVKVMALLSECIGAKGFESDTYFEMALRDVQLIPSLEGSTHINLSLTAQFVRRYFNNPDPNLAEPQSAAAGECASAENPYLMEARSSPVNTIVFPPFARAYEPLLTIPNVHHFAHQAKAFRLFVKGRSFHPRTADTQAALAVAQCMTTIAFGQLVAENCVKFNIPRQMVSAMFHLLVNDLSISALTLASSNRLSAVSRILIRRLVTVPKTTDADWGFVLNRAKALGVLESPAV